MKGRAVLLVDSRAGSRDLTKSLKKLLGADRVEETTLDFGDLAFTGRGAGDKPLDVGIEFKKLADIAQCCRDGRFAGHQLPGMVKTYDYSWLLIEGNWRSDGSGLVATYQGPRRGWHPIPGRMRASELEKHILTFELCGGIHTRYVNERADTLRFVVNLFRWWSDRAFDAHTSHLAVHEPAMLGEVSDFRRAVMQWPSIGLKTSKSVEEEFNGSVTKAATASMFQWSQIQTNGKRFGESNATRVFRFLNGL